MRIFFLPIICLFFLACSNSTQKSAKKPSVTFDQFTADFEMLDTLVIDSLQFRHMVNDKTFPTMKEEELHLVKSVTGNQRCKKDDRYKVFKVGRVPVRNNDAVLLLYYFSLNPLCQYDGYEDLFVLCSYLTNGDFLSERIVGKRMGVPMSEEYTYFSYTNGKFKMRSVSSYMDESDRKVRKVELDSLMIY